METRLNELFPDFTKESCSNVVKIMTYKVMFLL